MPSVLTPLTITAPAGVDGRGEIAQLNTSTDTNFVGYLFKPTGFGNPAVRVSKDAVVEGPGAVFGSAQWEERSVTLEIAITRGTAITQSDTRFQKLCRACNALSAGGTIAWTDAGAVAKQMVFRLENGPSDPDPTDAHTLVGLVAPDPRIYAATAQTGSSPKTNNGNIGSPPVFTLTPTGSNVVITNTTSGYGSPAVTLTVGGATGVSTGSAVTVDFGARTVTQGGVNKYSAVVTPASWWEVIPGANTWTVTNASSVSISFRDAWSSA